MNVHDHTDSASKNLIVVDKSPDAVDEKTGVSVEPLYKPEVALDKSSLPRGTCPITATNHSVPHMADDVM